MAAPLQQKITAMAEMAAAAHGVKLIVARFTGQQGRSTLEVLIETPEGTSPDVEVCKAVSYMLSAQLDVAELIAGRYTLEVSSAGLDRPLLSAADCLRFKGKGANFKFSEPQDLNGKPLGAAKGVIEAVDGETIKLATEAGPMVFAFGVVHRAELEPTEAELAAFMGFHSKPKRGTPHPLKGQTQKNPQKSSQNIVKQSTKESA